MVSQASFPITRRVYWIVALFVAISLLLSALIYLQGSILDGVRAFIQAESVWSNAQKEAVLYLERYSHSRDPQDLRTFRDAVGIIEADRTARHRAEREPMDYEQVYQAVLAGRNAPEDAHTLIRFYLNFQDFPAMQKAIAIWQEGEQKIGWLRQIADSLHDEIIQREPNVHKINRLREQLHTLNYELTRLEIRFAAALGEGARMVKRMLWIIGTVLLLAFVAVGIYISRQIIRSIAGTEQELLTSESRFRSLREADSIGIITMDLEGRILDANGYFLRIVDVDPMAFKRYGLNWKDITPETWHATDGEKIESLRREGRCEPYEKEFIRQDGRRVRVYLGVSMLESRSEEAIAYVVDLSEREEAERQTRLASAVFSASDEGILIADASLRIVMVNEALLELTGYRRDELIGRTPAIFEDLAEERYRTIYRTLRTEGLWKGEIANRKKSGELVPIRLSISAVHDRHDDVSHYVAIFSDNTAYKMREEQLQHQANHDALTGLPNRLLFYDRGIQAIGESRDAGTRFAILFFDLDRFKPVNDTYGHKFGDVVLKTVAQRLLGHIRSTDTLTRLGGDEFVVLLKEIENREQAQQVGEMLMRHLHEPMHIHEHTLTLSASFGIALYPDDAQDISSLLHMADSQMYQAKQRRPESTPKQS